MARVRFLDQVPVGVYTVDGNGGSGAGFPFSGSAVITGSLLISGSDPLAATLPVQDIHYIVTYNPVTNNIGYVDSTS